MKKQITFDFDGTLVNDWDRYNYTYKYAFRNIYKRYNLNAKLLDNMINAIPYRQDNISENMIIKWIYKDYYDPLINYETIEIQGLLEQIKAERLRIYETEKLLNFQTLFPDTIKVLNYLKDNNYILNIVSNRRNYLKLTQQLQKLKIYNLFEAVLSKVINSTKANMLKVLQIKGKNIFVTDTVNDIIEAQTIPDIKIYAISRGLDSYKNLKKVCNNTYNSLNEFLLKII